MPDQFPVQITVAVVLTDGDQFATATGAEFFGAIPTKAEVLANIAQAQQMLKHRGMKGFRLPTPSEFSSHIAAEKLGVRCHVAGPKDWQGFTDAELKQAAKDLVKEQAKRRKERADRDDGDGDEG